MINLDIDLSAIKEILEKEEYDFYGLRADTDNIEIGSAFDNSHQWFQDYIWDGDPDNDEDHPFNDVIGCWDDGELNGVCAIRIDKSNINNAIESMRAYAYGQHTSIYLVGGNDIAYGNDIGEIIICDGIALAKIGKRV